MTDVKTEYPDRYYASYDTTATQPTMVTGWFDTWSLSSLSMVPAASSMIAITETAWLALDPTKKPKGYGVQDGKIVDYTAPTTPVPLATQASTELTAARQTVWNEYGSLNEATPDAWVTYLKALTAIANGTDTTSTVLPTAPS